MHVSAVACMSRRFQILALSTHRGTFSMGDNFYVGADRKSLADRSWETCTESTGLGESDAAYPLTSVRVPAECLHTPDPGQGTCRLPACILLTLVRVPAECLQTPDPGQGTCIPLTLVRVLAGCLHTPDQGQEFAGNACKVLTLVEVRKNGIINSPQSIIINNFLHPREYIQI